VGNFQLARNSVKLEPVAMRIVVLSRESE